MKIRLTNNSGLIKEADWGFSWKTLIFGAFVPLLRGDLAWFFIGIFLAVCTFGFAWLVFPFYYNKIFVKKLLAQGFYPLDELSRMTLVNANIIRDQAGSPRTEFKVPQPATIPSDPVETTGSPAGGTTPAAAPLVSPISTAAEPTGWTCGSCMTENAPENRFCFSCGREREKPKPVCPQCGKENQLGMKFCPSCGTSLSSQGDRPGSAQRSVVGQDYHETRDDQPIIASRSFPAKGKGFLFLALGALVVISSFLFFYVREPIESGSPTLEKNISYEGDVVDGKASVPPSDAEFLSLCRKGEPAEIQAAIKAGANVNAYSEDEELNALMYAAIENSHPETIRMLVNAGADVNETFGSRSNSGMTALMYAAEKNPNPEILIELVKAGADVDEKDMDGGTPLKYATRNRNEEVLKVLLKSGAHVNDNHSGETVLHFASDSGNEANPNTIRVLLDNGADVHIRDQYGRTPLICAAGSYKPNPKVVAMLLNAGADVNAKRNNGWTPLIAAVFQGNGNLETLSLLLKAGADVNARDEEGKRAVDFAKERKDLKGTEVYRRLEVATVRE